MNLTLSLWLTLLGRLATEAVLLVALATAAQRFVTSPHAKGTLWQAVLLGVALVWLAEMGGVRSQVARWWSQPPPNKARHLVVTLPGEPVSNLSVPDGFDTVPEPAFPEAVAKPVRPVWWPLQLWLAGCAALLFRATALRLWLGFVAGRRTCAADAGLLERVEHLRRRMGLRRVRVLAWPGLRSPIAFGTLRPTIALPADFAERFSHEAQEAMLAHELAHLAAGDPFWLALADAVLALAWWHPAVWWARRQLRAASEATADEASALVPGGRVALAESLVTLGRELAAPGWTRGLGVAGDGLKSQLARRVTALLRPAGEWRAVRPARLWLARGATLITATGLVALPWPGAGGPAFARVLMASAAEASPIPSASGNPLKLRFQTVPATDAPPLSGRALSETARLSYEEFRVESPSAVNGLNLSNPYRGAVGLPDEPARPLREQYQEGAPKARTAPGVSDDRQKPAHAVYVALRAEDPVGRLKYEQPSVGGSAVMNLKPEGTAMQQRYQLAQQAAAEADRVVARSRAEQGSESAEFARATEQARWARGQVLLLKEVLDTDQDLERLRAAHPEQPPAGELARAEAMRGMILAKLDEWSRQQPQAAPAQPLAPEAQAAPGNGDSTGRTEPENGIKTAGNPEFDQRYQQALQAAKAADLAAVPIFEAYGKDSPQAAQATERYKKADKKVQLYKEAIATEKDLQGLRAELGDGQPRTVRMQTMLNMVLEKLEVLAREESEAATQLFTRQFKLGGDQLPGITEHFRRFLPPGETNLQVAIRIFCATNGVEMPAYKGTPPPDRKAVFFNDRTGVLFVRAPLDDLDRIEKALQILNIPPGDFDEIRSGQAKQLQASEARLAELRTHYDDSHPKVVDELDLQAHIHASQRDIALNGRTVTTNATPAGASADAKRQMVLEIQFAEVVERGSDDVGLDWIFGQSPTNNPVLQSGPATNLLTEPGSPHGQNLRVDLLRTEGESATLTETQFAALRKRLESRSGVEFLTAPKVLTLSGRQARVEVGEEKTIVSGVEPTPAGGTNLAGTTYQTEKVRVGPKVDLFPVLEGDDARVGIIASVTEFLGYDQPAVPSKDKSVKGATGATPLPRLRVRTTHADSLAKPGETIALRGPLVADTLNFKDKVPVLGDVPLMGRLFRSESKSTVRKRLYVFVTPTEVTAAGERVVPAKAVPGR